MTRITLIAGIIFQLFFLIAPPILYRDYGALMLFFPFGGMALTTLWLCLWAKTKKRHPCWGLFGLLPPLIIAGPVVGTVVVALLKRGDSEAFLTKKAGRPNTFSTHAKSAPNPPNKLKQLQEAAELKNKGVLTEEEFEAEKAKLLNR